MLSLCLFVSICSPSLKGGHFFVVKNYGDVYMTLMTKKVEKILDKDEPTKEDLQILMMYQREVKKSGRKGATDRAKEIIGIVGGLVNGL